MELTQIRCQSCGKIIMVDPKKAEYIKKRKCLSCKKPITKEME